MYEIYQRLLDEKGIKNSDVSRGTGISNMTLSDWKRGKSTPKYENMKKIAQFLDVSVDYLMNGEESTMDYIYNDENVEFLIEVSKNAKDKDFMKRIMKYMSLLSEDKKSVDDMIDFMYNKEHQGED